MNTITTHTDVLNFLIERMGYRRYLEIGVRDPEENLKRIAAEIKVGVDPWPFSRVDYHCESDNFFRLTCAIRRWDLVFVDGDHRWATALRDVANSLALLLEGGTVVMHDCLPICEEYTQLVYGPDRRPGNGTAWKAYALLRMSRPDLTMCCIEMPGEDGIGIIRHGRQQLFVPPDTMANPSLDGPDHELTWDFYQKHRNAIFAPVTAAEFTDHLFPRMFPDAH
jgi:CheY-like chemotaxis protein